jgi:hypothetical protein
MSMSLYYIAERETPLTDAEWIAVGDLVVAYPWERCADPRPAVGPDDLIVARYPDDLDPGEPGGLGDTEARDEDDEDEYDDDEDLGEPFELYQPEPDQPDVVLDGSLQPPMDPENFANAVNYWCELLAKIRMVVPGARWHVHLDDTDLSWSETEQCYYLEP